MIRLGLVSRTWRSLYSLSRIASSKRFRSVMSKTTPTNCQRPGPLGVMPTVSANQSNDGSARIANGHLGNRDPRGIVFILTFMNEIDDRLSRVQDALFALSIKGCVFGGEEVEIRLADNVLSLKRAAHGMICF